MFKEIRQTKQSVKRMRENNRLIPKRLPRKYHGYTIKEWVSILFLAAGAFCFMFMGLTF